MEGRAGSGTDDQIESTPKVSGLRLWHKHLLPRHYTVYISKPAARDLLFRSGKAC